MTRRKRFQPPAGGLSAREEPVASALLSRQRVSAQQLWQCLKRWLAFEEPADRWGRLTRLLDRFANISHYQGADLAAWPLPAKAYLHNALVGGAGGQAQMAETLFNVALALEDLERFQRVAFEIWLLDSLKRTELKVHGPCPAVEELERLLVALSRRPRQEQFNLSAELFPDHLSWISELGFSGARAVWLAFAATTVPNWLALKEPGPWQSEALASFVAETVADLSGLCGPLSALVATRAQAIFRERLQQWRPRLPGTFLPNVLILVEGQTEALLLPFLARCLGLDLDAVGVAVLPAGGANQVVRRYLRVRDVVLTPVVCVLDRDAGEQAGRLSEALRQCDRLHVLSDGEIEDVFDNRVMSRLVNQHLGLSGVGRLVAAEELPAQGKKTGALARIWRESGLGGFDKIAFARTILMCSLSASEIHNDVKAIVSSVKAVLGDKGGGKDGA